MVRYQSYLTETLYSTSRYSGRKYHRPEIDALKRQWAALRNDEERAKFKDDRATFVKECKEVQAINPLPRVPL